MWCERGGMFCTGNGGLKYEKSRGLYTRFGGDPKIPQANKFCATTLGDSRQGASDLRLFYRPNRNQTE